MRDLEAESQSGLDDVLAAAEAARKRSKTLNLAPWRVSEPANRNEERNPWESLLRGHIDAMAPRVLHGFDPVEDVVVIALPEGSDEPKLNIRTWDDDTGKGVEIWLGDTLVAHILGLSELRHDQVGIVNC